jgi:hypothetical protein
MPMPYKLDACALHDPNASRIIGWYTAPCCAPGTDLTHVRVGVLSCFTAIPVAVLSTTLFGSGSFYVVGTSMLALRRRKTTSNPDTIAPEGNLRRALTGTLRVSRRGAQIARATPKRDEIIDELEAAVSTVSTALSLLRDLAGALQNIPYVGAVAVAAVRVLEIREEMKDNKELFEEVKENVARRTVRLLKALQSQASFQGHHLHPSEELLGDLEEYERYV